MSIAKSLLSGLAGAVTLTILHETARRILHDAPRMDLLGMRAIEKGYKAINETPPSSDNLFALSMAGDMLSNTAYYSLAGCGKNSVAKGAFLGLAAGIGGVVLPGPMGLGEDASARTPQTKIMTCALYLLGGLTAGAVAAALNNKK